MAHVLIVDDDLHVRRALEGLFSAVSIETVSVADGAEAIELLATATFAAILLDLRMPVVSGFEVLDHIRSARPELMTRVLLITGLPIHIVEDRVPELRDRVFLKPFDPVDLIRSVEGHIALYT